MHQFALQRSHVLNLNSEQSRKTKKNITKRPLSFTCQQNILSSTKLLAFCTFTYRQNIVFNYQPFWMVFSVFIACIFFARFFLKVFASICIYSSANRDFSAGVNRGNNRRSQQRTYQATSKIITFFQICSIKSSSLIMGSHNHMLLHVKQCQIS